MRWKRATAVVQANMMLAIWTVLSAPSFAQMADQGGFRDDFNALDRERWYVSSGWVNGEHQNCLWHESQMAVEGGILHLSLTPEPRGEEDFSCAEIQSEERFGYGAYEARMKVPFAPGVNANFFTFIGKPQKRPHDEIDFEFITRSGPMLQTNYYVNGPRGNEAYTPVPGADAEFNTYSFIWEPESLRWFINGKLIREERGADLPEEKQKIYASIWSTGTLTDWLGTFDAASLPLTLEVDWIAYTPHGDECQFENSIVCGIEWADSTGDR